MAKPKRPICQQTTLDILGFDRRKNIVASNTKAGVISHTLTAGNFRIILPLAGTDSRQSALPRQVLASSDLSPESSTPDEASLILSDLDGNVSITGPSSPAESTQAKTTRELESYSDDIDEIFDHYEVEKSIEEVVTSGRPKRLASQSALKRIRTSCVDLEEDYEEADRYTKKRDIQKTSTSKKSNYYDDDNFSEDELAHEDSFDDSSDTDDEEDEEEASSVSEDEDEDKPVTRRQQVKYRSLKGMPSAGKQSAQRRKSSANGTPVPTSRYINEFESRKGLTVEDSEDPPISDIYDMFKDIVSKNPEIEDFVNKLAGRKLRVATMCSGTESPLLALRMSARAAKDELNLDFDFEHVFSCEIEPFKQAYIERNFRPPILFRDVCELGNDFATTAYGAKVAVPSDVDILVAGTSCVDYSNLNNNQKKITDNGESGRTYFGMRSWVVKCRPSIVILENVCSAPWEHIRKDFEGLGYATRFVKVDSKNYYIPHTRTRVYLCAFNTKKAALADAWVEKVKSSQRPASCSLDAFMLPADDQRIQVARLAMAQAPHNRSRTDWARCEDRHHKARFDEMLGQKRPLTQWVDNGVCKLLDFGWGDWAASQVSRVLDLMDISTLRAAKVGLDPCYKTELWNLSQNVDRSIGSRKSGISTCITPSIIPYITNRGGPMVGLESLSMQGLPIDELYLTKETEDNLFDLAGNAMTTTVVGTCMLAALSIGASLLKDRTDEDAAAAMDVDDVVRETFIGEDHLEIVDIDLATYDEDTTLPELLVLCNKSRRLCTCEGRSSITMNPIQICKQCGFTSCSRCGGRPEHDYEPLDTSDRVLPTDFEKILKKAIPMRVKVEGINDADFSLAGIEDANTELWDAYVQATRKAIASDICFSEIRRQDQWSVKFSSASASLELQLGQQPRWLLFANIPKAEPAKSQIRSMLEQPVARMSLDSANTLFDGTWELCIPTDRKLRVYIEGTGEKIPTWQARLGILGDFENDKVWKSLKISAVKPKYVDDFDGIYTALPNCGTATDSLYKREGETEKPLFLFFDPTRCGDPAHDSFCIARETRRLGYGETRQTIVKLDATWRPTASINLNDLDASITAFYKRIPRSTIGPYKSAFPPSFKLPADMRIDTGTADCHNVSIILACNVKLGESTEELWEKAATGKWLTVDNLHARGVFRDLSWVTERVRSFLVSQEWIQVSMAAESMHCSICAPPVPELVLLVDAKQNSVIRENVEQAGDYEIALKQRPEAFVTRITIDDDCTTFQIGLNTAALIHRAISRLQESTVSTSAAIETSYRLTLDFQPILSLPEAKFKLLSNRKDKPHDQPALWNKMFPLRPEQLRSLGWMLSMESDDVAPFVEEEIMESILQPMAWRAEGKAQREVTVYGGVLADEVGYGKTAITLGLISCTQDDAAPADTTDHCGGIPIKATLIIIPGHLVKQWTSEIHKFTEDSFIVITISDLSSLNSVSIEDMMNADIVVAPSSLFGSPKYLLNLACLAGVRDIPSNGRGGRQFAFRYTQALERLEEQTEILINNGATELRTAMKDKFHESFEVISEKMMPSKRLKGRRAFEALNEEPLPQNSVKTNSKKLREERNSRLNQDMWELKSMKVKNDWKQMKCPPFELFKFNRVVIDEYTYLEGTVLEMIKHLSAKKRWILSGTPPLHDFASVKTIASFMGIHLGVDDDGEGDSETVKRRKKEQTAVEKFHSFREVRSLNWHAHRNTVAQTFLDKYVRQNLAEIDEIPWSQKYKTATLTLAERAIYLELDHHLKAQEMKIMRRGVRTFSDRERRLNKATGDAQSAKEALLKCSSHFDLYRDTSEHMANAQDESITAEKECGVVLKERSRELNECRDELLSSLIVAEETLHLLEKKYEVTSSPYSDWKYRLKQNSVGDMLVTKELLELVNLASHHADIYLRSGKRDWIKSKHVERHASEVDLLFELSDLMHAIRRSEKEYVFRKRSARFFQSILHLQQFGTDGGQSAAESVNCGRCSSIVTNVDDLAMLSSCGHMGCAACVNACVHQEQCFMSGCNQVAKRSNIITRRSLLDTTDSVSSSRSHYGSKIMTVIDVITKVIPQEDRVLLFVQFPDLTERVRDALDEHGVNFLQITGATRQKTDALDEFQDPNSEARVLLLNVADESASGANLTVANHIIFLSPLLATSMQAYTARETQAIGRARRYGQSKYVHVWRFFTRNTMDTEHFKDMTGVDIDNLKKEGELEV
ncbi:uncharacterized protein V1518DRAFT_419949 [Limtongia smithiae]|uniref:uncharacterized protein n=1 Tax=Limtongia smithiae TaxID=1125753 RepID=UPI0034CF216E